MVARALKITFFSVRVESMGSMEARGRLFLPHWGKWCAGRWENFTLAPDYNICNRGRAARAWAAADEGGIAATRGWSWTGRWRVLKAPREFYIPACSFLVEARNWLTVFSDVPQALLDTLSPQFSAVVPGPEHLSPSVLRDMYSLLGEGGERFPAIVLDSEPAWLMSTLNWLIGL